MLRDYLNDEVNESSLSKIYRKIEEYPSGAITAYRGDFTKKENKARNKVLMSKLLMEGYDVVSVKGSYIEDFGSEKQKEVSESSFLVTDRSGRGIDVLEKDLIKLGKKFDQDSVLIIPPGEKPYLIGTSKRSSSWPPYGKKEPLGKFKGGKGDQFFSRIKGRKFTFEEVEIFAQPNTISGRWGLHILSEKNWQDIVDIM